MPPITSTRVIPTATTVRSGIWLTMIRTVWLVQKCLAEKPKKTLRPASTSSMATTSLRLARREERLRADWKFGSMPAADVSFVMT